MGWKWDLLGPLMPATNFILLAPIAISEEVGESYRQSWSPLPNGLSQLGQPI